MAKISIHGHEFSIDDVYAEGYTINEAEAATLNQTLMENLGNNFRSKIKDAAKEHGVDLAEGEKLPAHVHEKLVKEFAEAADAYEFGVRRAGVATTRDPVMAEALRLAKSPIKEALKNAIATGVEGYAGKTIKDFTNEQITAAATRYLEGKDGAQILEIAKRNVDEKRKIGNGALEALTGL